MDLTIPADVAADVSDAERAILHLNTESPRLASLEALARLLLRVLPSAPIVTVSTAARLVGRSVQATNEAIEQLAATGVLKQTTIGRRNRAFEAVGLLDALTDFERGLASPEGDTASPPIRPVPFRPAEQSAS